MPTPSELLADVPNEENQSFKTYLHWLQCVCPFLFSSCNFRDDVALSLGRTLASLRHLLACSQPSHTRLMCPHTLHGGRHTIVMSCYFFPMQTRLPSSRSRPARSREIISMYGTSCRSMHSGLMAVAHICGGQSGIKRVRGSGERSSVSPPT